MQDLDGDHLPIIEETMSYSDWGVSRYTGTPKSLDNTIEREWRESSQAEWIVPCFACGAENVPSVDHHLLDMIGPYSDDISEEKPGTICHSCRRPISPRFGRWFHRYPERRWEYAGYHVPQVVMPQHYAKPDRWAILKGKVEHLAPNVVHNEVLGESYDTGSKLVSETELRAAADLPWENRPEDPDPEMLARIEHYPIRIVAADWGGGGKKGVSYTKMALLGLRPNGVVDCLWGRQLLTPHDHIREANEVRDAIARFRPQLMAHDYTGAGAMRETLLVQAGIPIDRIMAVMYVRSASHSIIHHVPPSVVHPRSHYQVDKTRSLLYTANAIKLGLLHFFRYDYVNKERQGLMCDFLALIDEKVETHGTGGIYIIKRAEGFSDDFAHAVNIGCVALWHASGVWPDFAARVGFAEISQDQLDAAIGPDQQDAEGGSGYFAR